MKALFTYLFAFFLTTSAHAINIKKGNYELGGAFTVSKSIGDFPGANSYSGWSAHANGQYFFADHLSAGLDTSFAGTFGSSAWLSVGPVVTQYFAVKDNIAPYVSLTPISWGRYTGSGRTYWSSSARLGTKFFLNDSVAFGPALEYERQYAGSGRDSVNNLSFLGVFSIHL